MSISTFALIAPLTLPVNGACVCLLVVIFGLLPDIGHNMLLRKLGGLAALMALYQCVRGVEVWICVFKVHILSSLFQLLGHLESTSSECLPHPGVVGMTAPAPAINQFTDIAESRLLAAVEQQRRAETHYHSDTYSLPWYV